VISAPVAAAAPAPLRGAVALAVLADAGALPHAGLGLSLEGSLQFRRLRVVGIGALFASQQTLLPGSTTGGDFQLAVGGVMACLTQGLGRWTVLVCGGAEVGRLSAEGVGVNNPKLGAALWAAGRGDAGAVLSLGPRLALLLRGGVALPVTRPTFVLDGETPVHRPSSVTARATLGVEMLF